MGRRKSSAGSDFGDSDSMGGSQDYPPSGGGGRRGRRSGGDPDFEEDVLEVDPFEAAVEQLYEKRATTRESALSTIVSLLAQYRYDDCAFREDTLTQLFLSSLRRGKEAEACLAAKALGLHVTTLGASSSSEAIYQEAERVMEPLILTGKSVQARVAAIDALATLCFVGSDNSPEVLHTMHTLWRVVLGGWKKAAVADAVVAALRGWAFLLTTVPSHRLDAHFVETHLGLLAQLLNGGDVDVRSAAGEAIALLWQMGDLSSLPESPRVTRTHRSSNGRAAHDTLLALAVGSPPKSALPAAAALRVEAGSPAAQNGSSGQEAAAAGGAPEAAAAAEPPAPAAGAEAAPPAAIPEAAMAAADQRATAGLPPLPPRPPRQSAKRSGGGKAAAQARAEEQGGCGESGDDEEEVDSLEAIVERMRDLAKNRGDASRLNKGDRASSRSTFRDLLSIIQGEYVPETKIKLRHGDLLVVAGLLDTIRLNFLRGYLGEAFQSHLQRNELLHEVFQYSPADEPEERLTPLEKRLFRSKSSTDVRDRTELRRKERLQMSSYKHGSLADY